MRPLLIDDDTKLKARAMREQAIAHPITLEQLQRFGVSSEKQDGRGVIKTAEAPPQEGRPQPLRMLIEHGFSVCYAVEQQPPPAGLCGHLSIALVDGDKDSWPNPVAVEMIAGLFDMSIADSHIAREVSGVNAVHMIKVLSHAPASRTRQ